MTVNQFEPSGHIYSPHQYAGVPFDFSNHYSYDIKPVASDIPPSSSKKKCALSTPAIIVLIIVIKLIIIAIGVGIYFLFIRNYYDSDGTCGVSSIEENSLDYSKFQRIVGGQVAPKGAFPSIVKLIIRNKNQCGGTIIHKKWIVSAAHCFVGLKMKDWKRIDIMASDNSKNQFKVKRLIQHPNFDIIDDSRLLNDIALVELENDIKQDNTKRSACLPSTDANNHLTEKLYVAGWGRMDKDGTGPTSKILQYATLNQYEPHICSIPHAERPHTICAGDTLKVTDTCKGDSGGPIYKYENDRWVLLGITSYGKDPFTCKGYGIYTNVYKYVDWIRSTID
ncbi:hypothetical protein SNEBB_002804 [Seison nebaliae]|nr:hypothetical protein SNEBB_002804 [Seison nebaliae]